MKLLVYTENYGRGGGNRYLVDLINAVAGDYDEVVLCSNPGGIYDEDFDRLERPVTYREIGIVTRSRLEVSAMTRPRRGDSRRIAFARRNDALLILYNRLLFRLMLWRYRPSAVLACNGGYPAARSTLALVLEAGRDFPTILSVVSTPYPRADGDEGESERVLDLRIWGRVRRVIGNARTITEALETRREAPKVITRVVHNGLPSTDHHRSPSSDARGVTIGCVSRFDPEKGLSTLVEAFARVAASHPEVGLMLVGGGREHLALTERLAELRLSARASLPGHVPGSVDEILAGFDIFAFPSTQEGLPYAILEAMRAGCAVVSTNVGGIPEVIVQGETGLLVPHSDVDALAEALDRLVSDESLRVRLGSEAQQRFEKEFSLDAMKVRAREVFREAGMFADRNAESEAADQESTRPC